ncbi:uncharacterized protein [Apostichopus japonicus]
MQYWFVLLLGLRSSFGEEEIIQCHAGYDTCPPGYYCSTVSNRCWPCHLCGNIDIYQSRFTHKCVCDGGLNGDPFAICSNFPPPGQKRQSLIRSDDDIHESLRDRAEGYFNGSKRDQNCPKPNTSTTQSISTLSEGNATTKVVPVPSDGDIFFETTSLATEALTNATSQDQPNISSKNNADTSDRPATTGLSDWRKVVFIAATVPCVVLVFVVVLLVCLYRSRRLNNQGARRTVVSSTPPLGSPHDKNEPPEATSLSDVEDPSVSDRLVSSDSSEMREIGSSLETAETSCSVPDLFAPYSGKINAVSWIQLNSPLNALLQDERLKRRFVTTWFNLSIAKGEGAVDIICRANIGNDFIEYLKEQTEIFDIDTYDCLATTLRDPNFKEMINRLGLENQCEEVERLISDDQSRHCDVVHFSFEAETVV